MQGVSADGFIGHAVCRAFPLMVFLLMGFAGRFRWCFFWPWDLQDVSADGFFAHGICRTVPLVFFWPWDLQDISADVFFAHAICRTFLLMFFLAMGFAGRFR